MGNELDGLDQRAKVSGAEKLYILDVVDEFADDYIVPCVQAGAVYENKYLLGTSILTGSGNYFSFFFMIFSIQNIMRNPAPFQHRR